VSAGGGQSIAFDGAIDFFNGCRPKRIGCAGCPACRLLTQHGIPLGVVYRNTVWEWQKIHNRDRVKPHGLYLLCSTSDFFIEDGELWWSEIVELLGSRLDVTFVALTKRLEVAQRFVTRFGALPNLWLGASAENQEILEEQVAQLYTLPAAGYVLSLQPLLAPLDLATSLDNPRLNYVITGCEFGDHARPCEKAWIDSIEFQCQRQQIDYFVTRWRDEQGHIQTNHCRNNRGGNHWEYPGFNSNAKNEPTVGSMVAAVQSRRSARQRG